LKVLIRSNVSFPVLDASLLYHEPARRAQNGSKKLDNTTDLS
jgi:hypothetical protein